MAVTSIRRQTGARSGHLSNRDYRLLATHLMTEHEPPVPVEEIAWRTGLSPRGLRSYRRWLDSLPDLRRKPRRG